MRSASSYSAMGTAMSRRRRSTVLRRLGSAASARSGIERQVTSRQAQEPTASDRTMARRRRSSGKTAMATFPVSPLADVGGLRRAGVHRGRGCVRLDLAEAVGVPDGEVVEAARRGAAPGDGEVRLAAVDVEGLAVHQRDADARVAWSAGRQRLRQLRLTAWDVHGLAYTTAPSPSGSCQPGRSTTCTYLGSPDRNGCSR